MSAYNNPLTIAELQQRVDDLKRAYTSGIRSVRHSDGRERTFGSMAEMLTAIQTSEGWIQQMSTGVDANRCTFAQHQRGDGPGGPSLLYDPFRYDIPS